MKNLKLYTGNRLEVLSEALAEVLHRPLSSPLDKEVIVVQSKGMQRWMSMEIARHQGVFANAAFYFPNAFVYEILRSVMPDLPDRSPYDPEIMVWKVMKILLPLIIKPEFEDLRNYLTENNVELKNYQLAERIADMLDQYQIFRPEMIFAWEKGRQNHWQAQLWRELVKENKKEHRAALFKALIEMTGRPDAKIKNLPERVSVFGVSALPRFHMQLFSAISRLTEVNLFFMNPCGEYWGDILSSREIKHVENAKNNKGVNPDYLYLEQGNSLLASMGTLGKDFFDVTNNFNVEEIRFFQEPGEADLLACLQSDIMHLKDRPADAGTKKTISKTDRSIQIHSCHSPMREVEVLKDALLGMFEKTPDLIAGDVLVMVPDIETYAPYIQAVFDGTAENLPRIPFNIADQSIKTESRIIQTFLAILDLAGGRFGAAQIFTILELPAVFKKFDLSEKDLDLISRWIKGTRIRWGIDEKNREEMGLPDLPENTWRAGLDRLLLGYAMAGQEERMFGGILPFDDVEGSEAAVLGNFAEFIDRLFSFAKNLGNRQTLEQWSYRLLNFLDDFFVADGETEREIQTIRKALSGMVERQKLSGFEEKVDIDVIRCHLRYTFERKGFGFGFMSGGVTFCSMLPLRSIPFRVICLMGMNSEAYPRQSKTMGFDLIAKYPLPGDRSRRNDDRYLFLETLLSAREIFYISYVGQSIRDNSMIPPSVLVSEIMDYIENGFKLPEGNIFDHIVTKHRLQAFSPEYFKGGEKLFSFSSENLEVAKFSLKDRKQPESFITRGLSEPEKEWKTVELAKLCSFFHHPVKFLLNQRIGIYLEKPEMFFDERESFVTGGLEKYLTDQYLVKKRLAGHDLDGLMIPVLASGQLPHGQVGQCEFERMSRGVEAFTDKTMDYIQSKPLEPLELNLEIRSVADSTRTFKLTGRIDSIYAERLLRFRYAKIKEKDILKIWICHLALNSVRADRYPETSVLAGLSPGSQKESVWEAREYLPVENSKEILAGLLEKYWEGLKKPLCFFPESSFKYAQMITARKASSKNALKSALNIWTGNEWYPGESNDLYYQLCFANSDPLGTEFEQTAIEIVAPILKHQNKID